MRVTGDGLRVAGDGLRVTGIEVKGIGIALRAESIARNAEVQTLCPMRHALCRRQTETKEPELVYEGSV